ncbi:MAG: hypothetical protein P1U89_25570 [Verrucomicrobiales bacterium]|nr:hypothetical protein [Verrucomicrobiales bacterium]
MNNRSVTPAESRGVLRDFNNALGQQLFFWGRDVIHSDGNLLSEYGFERRKSEGLEGTSCYRLPYEGDIIELHGACAGRYSRKGSGFLYIRNRRRCFLYRGFEPPAPGLYIEENLNDEPIDRLIAESRKFLKWWLEYESWISTITAPSYRDNCYRAFRKLPKSRPWLPPHLGQRWLLKYAESPEHVRRAKTMKNEPSLAG